MLNYPQYKLEKLRRIIPSLKILIIGHKRHGKDYLSALLEQYINVSIDSSSMVACREFVFDVIKDELGYTTIDECHADRDNHRPLWFQIIKLFCYHDKTAFVKKVLEKTGGYNGLRNHEELEPALEQGLFDITIWVDALQRLEPEDSRSMTVRPDHAEYFFDNNIKTEAAALAQLAKLFDYLYDKHC